MASNQFWRPSLGDRGTEDRVAIPNRHKHLPLLQQRQLLPLFRHKKQILYALEKFATLILVSETGSGKSTQIPQFLHESGWTDNSRCVVCTQPRRIAAITIASRVADEMGCSLGHEVGYAIRFERKCTQLTRLLYCTDGILLRETMSDPLLSKYSVVMVDEAHERSLQSDILLGLLRKIRRKRKDLRIIVTSATLDAIEIKNFFETNRKQPLDPTLDTACIFQVQGRIHEIEIMYLVTPCNNYIDKAVETVLSIHSNEDWGDILVFLPGGEEIDSAIELLKDRYEGTDLQFVALYSSLPSHVQMQAFEPTPAGQRKVVVATNIAETSLTIEGIRFVVDSGLVKLNYFNVYNGVDSLVTCPISKASARQRAGRAGRTQAGKCYRLMTNSTFDNLKAHTPPEIQRTDLCGAILQLKALGIDDVLHFDFLSSPSAEAMIYGLEILYSLGALDASCKLTEMGEKMAEMSLEPRLSKALLSSWDFGCGEELLSIAAMCSIEYPFITQRVRASLEAKQRLVECIGTFTSMDGDHITLLNIFNAFQESGFNASWCDSMLLQPRLMQRAQEVRVQLRTMLMRYAPEGAALASSVDDTVAIRKCLVNGYFANAAQLASDGLYRTIRGQVPVAIHPTSVMARFGAPPEWVVFNDVVHSKTPLIRDIIRIDPKWLVELASHYYRLNKPRV